ncbi:imidazolonepropionase-like amidohydrolase [Dyadobacter jejuensis]|uniref:Imidazolonepropionase-like amidohydrolase n=1 Tax=Dyadobacter jejuensis TaxID=1082580 RepID=A0A316AMF4_9BACT|nr:amidohydrolase family protein [Dyadobacter jejuensis]PWJ58469.1 imidazolonepropionase-like amidohydrolase [Dyadobacter jejuensis]
MKYQAKIWATCHLMIASWLFTGAWAQNPAPGITQKGATTLVGGTIHVGDGTVIEKGAITFENGKITYIGNATGAKKGEQIDVSGKQIYPGIISLNTSVGLKEVASVRATLDYYEVGDLNPHIRALVAYNTDSEIIPTLRSNGILLSQAVPEGGIISGSSALFYSDGWNWEDAVLRKDDGVWLSWPSYASTAIHTQDQSELTKRNERRQGVVDLLKQTFSEAKAYAELKAPMPVNLRLEAMKPVLKGESNLYIRADLAKDIIEAVKFAQSYGIKRIVIAGGNQSYKITEFLRENDVAVIVNPTHRLPGHPDEPVYLPYALPGKLHQAGVKVAITYAGEWWRTRNLAFLAGTAAGFSDMSSEEALQLITKNAAEIAGVSQRVGTLGVGKDASLLVSTGDLLDMRGNGIEMAFIRGAKVNLDDKQKRLYEKYQEKYKAK